MEFKIGMRVSGLSVLTFRVLDVIDIIQKSSGEQATTLVKLANTIAFDREHFAHLIELSIGSHY